jgi:two-component sensor histidine kinase
MTIKNVTFYIILFYIQFGFCQSENYVLKKRIFTYVDGLPSQDITCGVSDKYGFLWFGTNNGLCRYDGKKIIYFSRKKYKFRGNRIANLTYDNDLGIIISYSKLFGKFNSENKACPETDVININSLVVATLTDYYKNLPFEEKNCFSIRNTPDNKIIFRSIGDFQEWNYSKKNGFKKQQTQNDEPKFFSLNIKNIHGFYLKNKIIKNSNISSFRLEKITTNSTEIQYDSEQFRLFKDRLKIKFSSNDYAATAIINDSTKLFHPIYGCLQILVNNDKDNFINAQVNSFFRDNQGNYWLCTNEGLIQLTVNIKKFNNFFTKEDKFIIGNNSVRGIYAEKDLLYANLYDYSVLKTKKGTTFFKGAANFAITKIDDWFWSTNFTLRRFKLQSKKMDSLHKNNNGEIWSIFNLNKRKILLGNSNGILLYDKKNNTSHEIELSGFPSAVFAYKIFRNRSNQIMVVADNGLYVLSEKAVVLDYFSFDAKTKNRQFPFENIYDIYQDKTGIYWIGTNYDGLFRWDKNKNTFRQFDIQDGFVSNTINCIQEDDFNNLWISTNYGLVQLNLKTFALKNYTTKDGVANNEFNKTSSFKDENGVLYFGGMNGVTSFNPKDFVAQEGNFSSPLSISSFNLFNQNKNIFEDKTAAILLNKKIVLDENYQFFNLSFSLMDYKERVHNYAYKIEGLNKSWNYTLDNNLKIGNLPYGNYVLKIKAQAENGSWSGQEIEIPVYVLTPFYKKWWFFVIVFLLAIGLVYIFFKRRNYALNKVNEKLEITVKSRTQDLEASLIEQLSLTQEIHHRVKNNLQFMLAMIEMQINTTKNKTNKNVLKDTSRRINAMTLVHDMLYNKEKIERISVKAYVLELVQKINEMVNDNNFKIEFDIQIDEVNFNISDCVSIGMITSELLSNAIKYAFKNTKNPRIAVDLKYDTTTQNIIYTIKDNGIGFEKDTNPGLGLRLIDIFSRQLNGTYNFESQNGTSFNFQFNIN